MEITQNNFKRLKLDDILNKLENKINEFGYISKDDADKIYDNIADKIIFIGTTVKFKEEDRGLVVVAANSYYGYIYVSDQVGGEIVLKKYSYDDIEYVYGIEPKIGYILHLLSLRKDKELEIYGYEFEKYIKIEYNKIYLELINRYETAGYNLNSGLHSYISIFNTGNEECAEELLMFIDLLDLYLIVPKDYRVINPDKNDGLVKLINKE